MKNSLLRMLIYGALWAVLFVSCEKSNDSSPNNDPVITEKGTSAGNKVSGTVGTTGGSLQSADGQVTLTIPSGALAVNTNISIEPITNKAPLGLGFGYRLQPEGTTFARPVKLTFKYTPELLDGVPEDFLWIVTQAADGSWNAALKAVVDKNTRTVSVEATHFSDWALGKFIDFKLEPSSKTILKGQSVQLKLSGFSRDKAMDNNMELVPLVPITGESDGLVPLTPIPPVESRLMDFRVKQWTLNGIAAPVSNSNGKLTASGTNATYTAPNKRPDVNPVAVTVQLESSNKEGKKASYLVTSPILVVESDLYLLVKVDGQTYEYFEYGFNGGAPPDPNNYAGVNCAVNDNKLEIAALKMENSNVLKNGFGLVFNNPSETTRSLVGISDNGKDDITFQSYPIAYLFDYYKREYDAAKKQCNSVYTYGPVSVTILTFDTKQALVRGYFSGTVHSESTTDDENSCRTPQEHTISGEFRLIIANYYFKQ